MQTADIETRKRELLPFIFLSIAMMMSFMVWKITLKGVPSHPPPPPQDEMVGKRAPNFTLPDMKGVKHSLSDYRGKLVFLNIWATWCKPCRDEIPSMQVLYNELKDMDFEMLAVSIDEAGKKVVQSFIDEFQMTFPVLLDPEGITSKLYKTTGVPETFLIDKNGTLIHKVIGPSDWGRKEWIHTLKQVINQGKNEQAENSNQ